MMTDKYVFPAILTYEEGFEIAVTFPDLPGCATCGCDEADAIKMAEEALYGHISCMKNDGDQIPCPSHLNEIELKENEVLVLVKADVGYIGEKSMTITDIQAMQTELQERYLAKWGGLSPDKGREKLLWLSGELGEVGDIMKKSGTQAILSDPETRRHFVEEMCDVMMYFGDVMLCYDIKPEEFERVYREKFEYNMKRWKPN